jgi:hypothetical protein
MRLLTSFSTDCVKNPGGGKLELDRPACLKNRRKNLLLANQPFRVGFVRLRTILSTKNVQKEAAKRQV